MVIAFCVLPQTKSCGFTRSANAGIYGHDFCNVDFCEKSFVDQLRAGRLTFEESAMFFAPHMLLVCFTAESSCDTGWPGYGSHVLPFRRNNSHMHTLHPPIHKHSTPTDLKQYENRGETVEHITALARAASTTDGGTILALRCRLCSVCAHCLLEYAIPCSLNLCCFHVA